MRKKNWRRPTAEERAEHVRTLTRLAERILDRPSAVPIWFVLMTGFPEDQLAFAIER